MLSGGESGIRLIGGRSTTCLNLVGLGLRFDAMDLSMFGFDLG